MEQNNEVQYVIAKPLGERVAALETRFDQMEETLGSIAKKLDELLELKQKGMGGLKLLSILAVSASGLVGIVVTILGFFNGRH